jgi:DNA-binding MarR family transcriptional regulator
LFREEAGNVDSGGRKIGTAAEGLTVALPLSTLLSQALVAFTIEFDNEFEHRMPHRTTNFGVTGGTNNALWLVSLVMWSNVMRLVGEEGVTVGEIQRQARTEKLNLAGMERWGYIVVNPAPTDQRAKPRRADRVISPTAKGRKAQEVWRPLFGIIEQRWEARFGQDTIGKLRESLSALVDQFDIELPEYLPILGYGLFAQIVPEERRIPTGARGVHLATLLSKALLAFTLHFERKSSVSLAISANVIRLLDGEGVRVRDLPQLTGVSKQAITMAAGFLEKRGYVVIKPDPETTRTKLIWLTSKGVLARDAYYQRLGFIEERWKTRFGHRTLDNLREVLELLIGEPTAALSPLFRGLEPYPHGWRASVPKPDTLPHHPMILHRGGYPDGS